MKAHRPSLKTVSGNPGDVMSSAMTRSGIRMTSQRRHVFEALMEQRDHPTAHDVFMRVKAKAPSISLATVYNCLEALTESGLIKHVNLDRAPSRYCANTDQHGHFFCDQCGSVVDIPLNSALDQSWEVPRNTVVSQVEVILRGLCSCCAEAPTAPSTKKSLS